MYVFHNSEFKENMHLYLAGNNKLLTDKRLVDQDMLVLYKTLQNNLYVTSLDLRFNNITDEGAKHLAKLIEVCWLRILHWLKWYLENSQKTFVISAGCINWTINFTGSFWLRCAYFLGERNFTGSQSDVKWHWSRGCWNASQSTAGTD